VRPGRCRRPRRLPFGASLVGRIGVRWTLRCEHWHSSCSLIPTKGV
jgi:hypothetical protein